jgi:hypothetical protein
MNSQRGQAVLISLQNDPDRQVGGWRSKRIAGSGEGHGSGENGVRLQAGMSCLLHLWGLPNDRVGSSGG